MCSVEKVELRWVSAVHRAIPIEPPIHYTMQIKHRTLIQAAVLLIVLVFAVTGNVSARKTEPTAQVVASP